MRNKIIALASLTLALLLQSGVCYSQSIVDPAGLNHSSHHANFIPIGEDLFHSPNPTETIVENGNWQNRNPLLGTTGLRSLRVFGGGNWLINTPDLDSTSVVFPRARDLDEEYAVGIAIGRRIRPRVRTELEYSYRENNGSQDLSGLVFPQAIGFPIPNSIESEVQTGMANVLFDVFSRNRTTVYAGVGLGIAQVNARIFDENQPVTDIATSQGLIFPLLNIETEQGVTFAFQAIAGLDRSLGQRVGAFVEYRYFGTGPIELSNGAEGNFLAHNLFGGLRFNF